MNDTSVRNPAEPSGRQYLLSIHQPDGDPPAPDVLAKVMRELAEVNREMKADGAWVFSRGLFPPSTATVARVTEGQLLMTDGPFTEGREHLGGIMIITAPDLDSALAWASRVAVATTLPIEVRPFQDEQVR